MNYTYSMLSNGYILRSDGAQIPPDTSNSDYVEFLASGLTAVPYTPTQAQQVAEYTAAIQQQLDSFAQTWGYDDANSAASYANSTNLKFKAEATAIISWRDQVWAWAESAEAAVNAGTQPAPVSVAAFVAQMPAAPARPAG